MRGTLKGRFIGFDESIELKRRKRVDEKEG